MLHAVGDRAVEAVVEAMEAEGSGWPERRVRLEHGDGVFPDLAATRCAIWVWAWCRIPVTDAAGAYPRALWVRSARSQSAVTVAGVSAGVPLALGSDGPLNPFLNLMFATTYPWKPGEALTRQQALVAYTNGSAYAEFTDQGGGRSRPASRQNLAVLSQNIFDVPAEALPATEAVMTMVGGNIIRDTGR